MTKEDIFKLISEELNKIEDIDEKLDYLADALEKYHDYPEIGEIISNIYKKINTSFENNEDPILLEFYNVLESTNDLIMNEQYEEVITILSPYQKLVDKLLDISNIDQDKLEVGCFFNEVEKQMFYYITSDPNKDIHLLNSAASEYYSRLALVYHNSLNYNKALECYKKILSFNPCSNQALLGMAYLAYSQENYLTSLEYLKEFSKYAFNSDMIFEAYQLLTNIYIQYEKFDYAGVFAYIGSSFAPYENLEETMLNVYKQYKNEIYFDIDNDDELDKFLNREEFIYIPNDDVMDVLYTMLLDYKNHNDLKSEYIDLATLILSLVEDEELEEEIDKIFKEYN